MQPSILSPEPERASELASQAGVLAAENTRLRAVVEQAQASAFAQSLRAAAQGGEAHNLRLQVQAVQASFFWRLTWPLRLAADIARGIPPESSADALRLRHAAHLLRREGAVSLWHALQNRRRVRARVAAAEGQLDTGTGTVASSTLPAPAQVLAPSVLIIAELSLQQCAKYRVWQKQEHFTRLGMACRVVDWRRTEECLSAAAMATQVIMYRVPGFPGVMDMIAAMHRLGLQIAWEVDDIIFDEPLFLQNRNVDSLEPQMRAEILSGVGLYRSAMLACDSGIASTPHLAGAMRAAGLADVMVIENALDDETLALAETLRAARARMPARDFVRIIYGSGTKTHNADFLEAAPALLRLLIARADVRLRLVGELGLPEAFNAVSDKVERLPPVPFARYMALLAESDINLAPLENTPFNDAKSNIKFLEAAVLGLPSVCSPRAHFTDVIEDGRNGLLADGPDLWFGQLSRLADDAGLRAHLGGAALQTVLSRYAPEALAQTQVAKLVAAMPDLRERAPLRVLFANIYYAPRSYGGATLVVEEMARRLHARGDVDVHIYTGLPTSARQRATVRTDQNGITVFAATAAESDAVGAFDDPLAGAMFGDVLDSVQPQVVHLHSLQGLSASLTQACLARGIPYVITLHDAWWLCARQFMVREDGKYCFQTTIDLHVCQNCITGSYHLAARWKLMQGALKNAALLLSPSQSHRALHLANGIAPDRIEVAPNGVRLPAMPLVRTAGTKLRFAFVGGTVDVKGYSVTKRAFEALERSDWQLTLVDNTLNLGFSTMDTQEWQVRGQLRIVPAYRQDDIDAFFAGIDVLVFASQWKESFGLTVREALARDVWVITTDGGGPAEAVKDGVNGTLIPLDGSHEALQAAIETLLDRPGRLVGFRNPHAGAILDYAAQAAALHATLSRVAATGGRHGR